MRERRKLSYEQDMALVAGRRVARANQRRRMAAKEQEAREHQEAEAREAAKSAEPARCPECEGTRRHDAFCSRPVELAVDVPYEPGRGMTGFEVFVKGREMPVAATAFQAPAEEEARVAAAAFGRDAYVVDRSKSVYDPPVYRAKA